MNTHLLSYTETGAYVLCHFVKEQKWKLDVRTNTAHCIMPVNHARSHISTPMQCMYVYEIYLFVLLLV